MLCRDCMNSRTRKGEIFWTGDVFVVVRIEWNYSFSNRDRHCVTAMPRIWAGWQSWWAKEPGILMDFAQIAIRKIFWHGPFFATCWNLQTFLQVLSPIYTCPLNHTDFQATSHTKFILRHQSRSGFCLGSFSFHHVSLALQFSTWTLNRSETLGR